MEYIDIPDNIKKEDVQTGDKAINNSIRNIIATPVGSVPGHPEFGSGISKYLFELLDPLTEELIKSEIEYAMDRWERRIKIITIDIISDMDYNRILIKMYYVIKNDPDRTEREFIYKTNV